MCYTSKLFIAVMAACIFATCKPTSDETELQAGQYDRFTLNWNALASELTTRADPQEGERVMLMGVPGDFDPLYTPLSASLKKRGAIYLGALAVDGVQPDEWSTDFIDQFENTTDEELRKLLETVDLGIMMPGAAPMHKPYKALQDILENSSRRTIHFHWAGAYDLNGQLLDLSEAMNRYYEQVVLETNYAQLSEDMVNLENSMRNNLIRVTTPEGTDISFEIGERPVTKQDGNASSERAGKGQNLIDREIEIPAGAIRVAPVEGTVNGTIAFPDAEWAGNPVTGLVMTFKEGFMMEMEARSGLEYVEKEISSTSHDAGRRFREFALGLNPLMPVQTDDFGNRWIPYYGYGAGVVRLSLGDNTELGGQVKGRYVRWNFFPDASVYIGDQLWVSNGTLQK